MSETETSAAKAFSALGHEVRLKIFRLLVRAGDDGLNVGEIGVQLSMPPSTLAHHLSALVGAGLVVQERQGREIISRVDFRRTEAVVTFLSDQCCAGVVRVANENVA